MFGGIYAIKALDLCDCFPRRQRNADEEAEDKHYPNYRKFNNEPIQHVQLRDLRGMLWARVRADCQIQFRFNFKQ